MPTAAIYARISQDRREDEAGVSRQLEDCRELAERHGYTVAATYVDNDVSASQPLDKRPAFMDLLSDAEDGGFEAVIAWRDDRLWRNPDHQRSVFELCNDVGIESVVTTAGVADPGSIDDRLTSGLRALVAEHEAAQTSLRVRRAARQRAEQGKRHGGRRPFGYEPDGVTVREEEAARIREAAERVLDGETFASVIRDWNEREVPTSSGGRWARSSFRAMLFGPRIAGLRQHHGEIIGEAEWEPIIDEETYERLQHLEQSNARDGHSKSRGAPAKHLLSAILRCGRCSEPLYAQKRYGDDTGRKRYTCLKRDGRGCAGVSITSAIEDGIRDYVVGKLTSADGLSDALSRRDGEPDGDTLAAQLVRLRGKLRGLAEDYAEDRITRDEYFAARETIERRIRETQRTIEGRETSRVLADLPLDEEGLRERWESEGVSWRREVLGALVNRIEVGPASNGNGERVPTSERLSVEWRA